jgi:hypothetical protein
VLRQNGFDTMKPQHGAPSRNALPRGRLPTILWACAPTGLLLVQQASGEQGLRTFDAEETGLSCRAAAEDAQERSRPALLDHARPVTGKIGRCASYRSLVGIARLFQPRWRYRKAQTAQVGCVTSGAQRALLWFSVS